MLWYDIFDNILFSLSVPYMQIYDLSMLKSWCRLDPLLRPDCTVHSCWAHMRREGGHLARPKMINRLISAGLLSFTVHVPAQTHMTGFTLSTAPLPCSSLFALWRSQPFPRHVSEQRSRGKLDCLCASQKSWGSEALKKVPSVAPCQSNWLLVGSCRRMERLPACVKAKRLAEI